mmetsp:Transcript_66950/g.157950  ORF Transcript_66950/g.157950 Transcript_66950/m.157950 type:complete len:249 (+) Transcript_66950:2445-3191(+)
MRRGLVPRHAHRRLGGGLLREMRVGFLWSASHQRSTRPHCLLSRFRWRVVDTLIVTHLPSACLATCFAIRLVTGLARPIHCPSWGGLALWYSTFLLTWRRLLPRFNLALTRLRSLCLLSRKSLFLSLLFRPQFRLFVGFPRRCLCLLLTHLRGPSSSLTSPRQSLDPRRRRLTPSLHCLHFILALSCHGCVLPSLSPTRQRLDTRRRLFLALSSRLLSLRSLLSPLARLSTCCATACQRLYPRCALLP